MLVQVFLQKYLQLDGGYVIQTCPLPRGTELNVTTEQAVAGSCSTRKSRE